MQVTDLLDEVDHQRKFVLLLEIIQMTADRELRQQGHKDFWPTEEIEDSHQGISFDYFFTGRRMGTDMIELHVTTKVMDWQEQVFIRKAWYIGGRLHWKACIREQLKRHMLELGVDSLMLRRMLQDLEVSPDKYMDWERYDPITYGLFE